MEAAVNESSLPFDRKAAISVCVCRVFHPELTMLEARTSDPTLEEFLAFFRTAERQHEFLQYYRKAVTGHSVH